ncbi:MAG: terminase large subunit domain-containing protein [Chloroflexota bacterium]
MEDVFAGTPECWLVVPESNGKSTLTAVLIMYYCEFSPDADIPVAASARDQAEIIFKQAQSFRRRTSALRDFECKPGLREIVFGGASKAKIFASDAGTGDGVIPAPLAVLDELHRHKSLELYRTWAGKLDKEHAQLIVISTAGEPGGEFELVREAIRQSAVDSEREGCFGRFVGPNSVMHEYAIPENGDVMDMALVKAANPSERITVETLEAKRSRPSWSLPHWRRLTCNLPTRATDSAITEAEWAAAGRGWQPIPVGNHVMVGFDAGWKWDTTAIVPFYARSAEERVFGAPTILTPPRDGDSLDPDKVKRALLELHRRTPIDVLVMDTSHAKDIASWAGQDLGCEVVERAQTNSFAVMDYQQFMQALRSGWLRQPNDPEFTRHVMNAIARLLPGGDTRFDRPHATRARTSALQDRRVIDALTAAAMVHSLYAAELETPASVYETRGPIFI